MRYPGRQRMPTLGARVAEASNLKTVWSASFISCFIAFPTISGWHRQTNTVPRFRLYRVNCQNMIQVLRFTINRSTVGLWDVLTRDHTAARVIVVHIGRPTEDRRLSRPRRLVKYRDDTPAEIITGPGIEGYQSTRHTVTSSQTSIVQSYG